MRVSERDDGLDARWITLLHACSEMSGSSQSGFAAHLVNLVGFRRFHSCGLRWKKALLASWSSVRLHIGLVVFGHQAFLPPDVDTFAQLFAP